MLKTFKQHWFGFFITLLALLYLTVFFLVLFSPRQDAENRGFTLCTKAMTQTMLSCQENKAWCMSKAVIKNTYCDTLVILEGLGAWIRGQQKTPWANYLFALSVSASSHEEHHPELQNFYDENPNLAEEMQRLDAARQKLEDQLEIENELEEQTEE